MTRRRIVIVAVLVIVLAAFAALGVFGFIIPTDCDCTDVQESLDSALHLFLLQVALTQSFDNACDCDVSFNLDLLRTGRVTQGNETITAYVVPVKRVDNSLIASTIGKVWTYRDVDFYFVWEG